MPALGLARVGFYRRDYPSGKSSYVVVFLERGRHPYRKWITLRSAHAPAAQREAYDLALSWHQGTFDPWEARPEDVSLSGAASAWMASGGASWSEATIRGRKGVLDLFLREAPGSRHVTTVTPADIERFLARASLSAVSRASYLRVLNTFFRWCKKERYVDEVPTESVERPRVARRGQVAYFTRDELERFCRAAEDHYEKGKKSIDRTGRGNFIWIVGVVRFAVATGLRKGELRHLRWGDVDLGEERLFARSFTGRWQDEMVRFRTKQGSDRIVPLFPMAAGVLEKRRSRRTSENPEEPVFLGPSAHRLGESQINKVFRQVREMAELPDSLDIHACRHTFASWLLSEGETLYRVSWWMGHSRISVTADLYGHFTESTGEVGAKVFSGDLIRMND